MFSNNRIRKVLLIQPPAFSDNERGDMNPNAPLGLGYIAAMLEREGYEVKVLDAFIEGWDQEIRVSPEKIRIGLPFEDIEEVIRDYAPDAVGVTSMFTSQRKNAHEVARLAKSVNSGVPVIFGGAHPTSAPEMVMADPNVDFVVLAEGDNSIVPLLRAIESGGDITKLDGICYHTGGGWKMNEKHEAISDLDSLPFPARHLLPMEKYFAAGIRHGGYSKRDRAASLITSRGCQYRCNFCTVFTVFTRVPRFRSVQNVITEIDELVTRYGVNEVFFEDDQFVAKIKHTEELLDAMVARNYDLIWDTPNGISTWLLSERLIEKMAHAGCWRVNLAIESGNQWVLKNIINKPVKLSDVPQFVKWIRKFGMEVGTFLVVGNISDDAVETLDQVRDSFRFARSINVKPTVHYLFPYPGSDVLRIAERKSYLIKDFGWDDVMNTKRTISTPDWTPEQLRAVVRAEIVKTRLNFWAKSPKTFLILILSHYRRNLVAALKLSFKYLKMLWLLIPAESYRYTRDLWLYCKRQSHPTRDTSPI
jgi:anaerobic magnesium-protoporphyrin IX monomethyl ester cyclase